MKFGESSHSIFSNKIMNFQESTPILNAHTKKAWKLIVCSLYIYIYIHTHTHIYIYIYICIYLSLSIYIYIYIYMCVCVCVCVCAHELNKIDIEKLGK